MRCVHAGVWCAMCLSIRNGRRRVQIIHDDVRAHASTPKGVALGLCGWTVQWWEGNEGKRGTKGNKRETKRETKRKQKGNKKTRGKQGGKTQGHRSICRSESKGVQSHATKKKKDTKSQERAKAKKQNHKRTTPLAERGCCRGA